MTAQALESRDIGGAAAGRVAKKTFTTAEHFEDWIERIKWGIRSNTLTAYKGYLSNHIHGSSIGGRAVGAVGATEMQKWMRHMKDEKGLSVKTVRLVFCMMKTGFQYAVESKRIKANPCDGVRSLKQVKREVEVFSRTEQKKLEAAVLENTDGRTFGITLCLYTGLRIGELCALKWSDIDWERQRLTVKQSLGRVYKHDGSEVKTEIREDEPKTDNAVRTIPLPKFLLAMLRTRRKSSRSEYVISMKNGRFVQPRTMQNIFYRLLERTKLKHMNFHILRHTFATRALELSVNMNTLSEILGHGNVSVTLEIYAHVLDEQRIKMTEFFDNFNKREMS